MSQQEPTEKAGLHAGHDRESRAYEHPAFGQISAHRISGATTLYGSDFLHHNFVAISISRSELNRDVSHDWHFPRGELIEVMLSEAQWATFVSSMNVGSGVPCTLHRVAGETMPGVPLRTQAVVFEKEFGAKTRQVTEYVDRTIAEIEGEIGKSLSGAKREKILASLHRLRTEVSSNMPFVARSFAEHMERTVEKAKVEVNAYVQTFIQRAGLATLMGEKPPLQLGASESSTTEQPPIEPATTP